MPKARPRRLPPQRGPRPRGRRPQRPQPPAPAPEPVATPVQVGASGRPPVVLPKTMLVGELANLLEVSRVDVIQKLVGMGVMASVNVSIDFDTATLVAQELGIETTAEEEPQAPADTEETELAPVKLDLWAEEDTSKMKTRPPVVTILGHVDHGKTSLLDAIRSTNVTAREAGGITPRVPASARATQGITELLEVVLLVADVAELKANPDRPAAGRVVEAHMDARRGAVATVLVQAGTLERGDLVVAGTTYGRVRAMTDDKGKTIGRAEPS